MAKLAHGLLPREPPARAVRRALGGGIFLVGLPAVLWLLVLGIASESGVEWTRLPRAAVVTVVALGFFGLFLRDLLRGQGLFPVVRCRPSGSLWELRVANEWIGWRTVGTVRDGDTIELTQRRNNPEWARAIGMGPGTPYPRCVVHVVASGVDTDFRVSLPLHARYVDDLEDALRASGLDVTVKFRDHVQYVPPGDPMTRRLTAKNASDEFDAE